MRNRKNNKLFAGIVAGFMAASVIMADIGVAMASPPPPPGHHAQRPHPGHQVHRPNHAGYHGRRHDVRPAHIPRPGHVRPHHGVRPVPLPHHIR